MITCLSLGVVAPPPSLSVVIPAFNERERLPEPLATSLSYLRAQPSRAWEVIVVDDGSTDGMSATLQRMHADEPERLRIVRSPTNHGKGAAVAAGVAVATGERILLMDADGSTPLSALPDLEQVMDERSCGVVVGERSDARPWYRQLMGTVFRRLAATAVTDVADTQCGFKLLTRDAAARTLPHLHVSRWAYDVEMLHLAQRLKFGVASTRVPSVDVPGSKVQWWTPAEMLVDVLRVSTFYRLGVWEAAPPSASSSMDVRTAARRRGGEPAYVELQHEPTRGTPS